MLDRLGFHQRHRDLLQKQLDVPVLLSNVLIARLAAELLVEICVTVSASGPYSEVDVQLPNRASLCFKERALFRQSEINRLFQQQHWSRQRGCYG